MALIGAAVALALGSAGCRNTAAPPVEAVYARHWGVAIDEPGLPNLRKISDELYCGGQPTTAGLRRLPALGIKTIVNIRSQDTDRGKLRGIPLRYVYLPMSPWRPRDQEVVRFLHIATDKTQTPVFLHCEHGADRTGLLVAMYRITVQGWSKQDAIAEMTEGGTGFHPLYQNLVEYVERVDGERLGRQAGLTIPSASGMR
jgi:protein tyrosine/serine phosphatase